MSCRLCIPSPVIDCFLHSHGELCSPLFLACFVFVVKLCWPLISQVLYVSVHGPHSGDPWETCQRPSCVFIVYACEEVMLDILWPCIPCVWRGCAGDVAAIRCMSGKPWSLSRGPHSSVLSILLVTVNLQLCQNAFLAISNVHPKGSFSLTVARILFCLGCTGNIHVQCRLWSDSVHQRQYAPDQGVVKS